MAWRRGRLAMSRCRFTSFYGNPRTTSITNNMIKFSKDSRLIIHLIGLGTAVSLLGDATIYAVLPHPEIAAQVGVTLAMVGLLLGANRAARLVLNGPVGILYDRMPRRRLLILALAFGAFSSVFYAVGYGFWPLLVGRVLWGMAWSLLWVGGNSVVLDVSTEENRGRFSGIYQMWFFIGIASASFFGTLLTDLFGFRIGQWISVGVIGAMAVVWFFLLPETRNADDQSQKSATSPEKKNMPGLPWKTILATSVTIFAARFISWGMLAATAILWLSGIFDDGLNVFALFIPIATLTGIFTALSNLASIGSTQLAGSVSDRLGRRWPVIGLAMLLGGVGLWFMSGKILWLALAGAFLVPLAGSSAETLVPAVAGDRVPKELRSRALGLINTAGDLGATISPFMALGALNQGWLSLGEIYRIGGLLLGIVALSTIYFSKRTGRRDVEIPN